MSKIGSVIIESEDLNKPLFDDAYEIISDNIDDMIARELDNIASSEDNIKTLKAKKRYAKTKLKKRMNKYGD